MFGSHSQNQDKYTVSFILRQMFIFLFVEEAVRIVSFCKFSWSFGIQSWYTGSISNYFVLFQETKFSLHQRRQLLELALVLFLLSIWISDSLCLAHVVKIRMNSPSVSFEDRSLSSYFSRKLFKFWGFANSLDHLDSSLSVIMIIFFQEANFSFINKGSWWTLHLCFFSRPFGFQIVNIWLA